MNRIEMYKLFDWCVLCTDCPFAKGTLECLVEKVLNGEGDHRAEVQAIYDKLMKEEEIGRND